MARRPLRLLHTSDLHLGASAGDPGLDVLGRVIDLAANARSDAILMAGDVFDNSRVAQPTLDEAISLMAASRAPVVILPGNHDCLADGGVYERGDFAGGGITVIGRTHGELVPLHDLGLTVWGRPHRDHSDLLPLRDVPEFDPTNWRVNIAHGHWVQTEADERRAYRIFDDDINAQRADYLALGHWDVFSEVASSRRAFYSGSPLYAGSVNLVELDESFELRVTRLPVD